MAPRTAARLTIVALCAAVAVSAGQQQPPPVFRGGVKVVRVDVTVTGKGDLPVADLQAADFDVAEDGTPQRVEQVQFIRLDGQRPAGDETSLEIRSQQQAEAEAARDDVRVFVIFLDDYHVDKAMEINIPLRRALSDFIERLWPSDMVAMMDPLTSIGDLHFTRSRTELLKVVQKFEGRQGEVFPIKSVLEEAQLKSGDLRRIRAEVTFSALEALAIKLGGLREGRKSVLFVSQGPPTNFGVAGGTLQDRMRDIARAASSGNVTIYTMDPRGLGSYGHLGDSATLYQLADQTGGRAMVNTNNFQGGFTRMLADNTAYYVLGYTPTRSEDDGKYHKISVKVKRPGMHLLARQGYWAPSTRDIEAAAVAASRALPPGVASAQQTLAETDPGRRPVDVWVGFSRNDDGRARATVLWSPSDPPSASLVASLDVEAVAAAGAGAVPAVPGTPARSAAGVPPHGSRTFVLAPGGLSLRFIARTADGSEVDRWAQPVLVPDYRTAALALSTPRLYRARSIAELRTIRAQPDPVPSASRRLSRADRVLIDVDCYAAGAGDTPAIEAHVLTRDGRELTALPLPPPENGRLRFELPVGSFGLGTYLLRVSARGAAAQAEQLVAFQVVP